jgi:RNA recognition motif-containing protein
VQRSNLYLYSSYAAREVPNVSNALRAEFARGDGRVKRKEDDRRKHIQPSETLFVVNFQEQTTKRDDLRMVFEPFGELVRIEMKRNYAFVQFQNIESAIRAREEVNGGKLDQSVLTVEFVAQQRADTDRRGIGGGRDRRGGGDRRRDYRPDDLRRRSPPRDRVDDHRRRSPHRDRLYDARDRRSPPRYRPRSRSRSPPRYRSRSPRRDHTDARGRFDDYRGDRGADRGGDRGGDRWHR